MSWRAGAVLLSVSAALIAVGVVGTLFGSGAAPAAAVPSPSARPTPLVTPPPAPTANPTATPAPTPERTPAPLTAATDPAGDLYACGAPASPTPSESGVDILGAREERVANAATGEPSDALLISLAAPISAETGPWSARVIVTRNPPPPSSVDDWHGTQWIMSATDGQLGKSARMWSGDAWKEVDASDFNVRYQSSGDRAEVEFYGPVGTVYFGALLSNGESCDVILPAA